MHSLNRLLFTRRRVLAFAPAWAALAGCAAPWPPARSPASGSTAAAARGVLDASAHAHGLAAFKALRDLNISYSGEWRPLVNRLQPVLVDERFRQGSQERLLLREGLVGLVAQTHSGPAGTKQVVRKAATGTQGDVQVWFNGEPSANTDVQHAAALVVDNYVLFLLGPMALAGRALPLELGNVERVGEHECDVVHAQLEPGIGLSPRDRVALYIDRTERLMRRIRFSLDGLASTVGAVAEVDTFDHVTLHGVRWPTRFFERIVTPVPIPAHDWRLTGLDVNRGLAVADVSGPSFSGTAVAPAAALGPGR